MIKKLMRGSRRWSSRVARASRRRTTPREKPVLDLREYFNGKVDAWGMVQDRSGKVIKRMTVEMTCTWVGDVGTLDERFTYADGTKETRVWTIRKDGNRYIGTAADVVGEAKGEAAGNALRWNYVLDAKREDGGTIHLDMDDWMWLVDDEDARQQDELLEVRHPVRRGDDLLPQALASHGPQPPDPRLEGPALLDRRRLHRHRRGAGRASWPAGAPAWRCRRAGAPRSRRWRRAIGKGRALALPLDITDAPALAKAAAKLEQGLGRHRPRGGDGRRVQADARLGAGPRRGARDGRGEPHRAVQRAGRRRAGAPRAGQRDDRARLLRRRATAGCRRASSTGRRRRR